MSSKQEKKALKEEMRRHLDLWVRDWVFDLYNHGVKFNEVHQALVHYQEPWVSASKLQSAIDRWKKHDQPRDWPVPQPPRIQGFVIPPCPNPATFLLTHFPPFPNNTFQPFPENTFPALPDNAPFPIDTIRPSTENTFAPLVENAPLPVNANPALPNHAGHMSLPMAPRTPHPDRERQRHTGPVMRTHRMAIGMGMASLQPNTISSPYQTPQQLQQYNQAQTSSTSNFSAARQTSQLVIPVLNANLAPAAKTHEDDPMDDAPYEREIGSRCKDCKEKVGDKCECDRYG